MQTLSDKKFGMYQAKGNEGWTSADTFFKPNPNHHKRKIVCLWKQVYLLNSLQQLTMM